HIDSIDLEDENDSDDIEYQRTHPSSLLFSRGDSIDTVISAHDFDDEVFERDQNVIPSGSSTSRERRAQQRGGREYIGDKMNYTGEWGQDQDTIETRELGPAQWQFEFHRDRDSLPPPNGTKGESIALDIGSTSTE